MTINDIMLRDMAEADRRQKEDAAIREYERGVRFRLWRRRLHSAVNIASTALVVATLALLAWFCVSDAAHIFNTISR